jgi:hypothetical protein
MGEGNEAEVGFRAGPIIDFTLQGKPAEVIPTTAGCAEGVASGSAERSTRGEQEAQDLKQLCQIPSIGLIRAAMLLGSLQAAHRFRTKRQLWTYSGLGIEVHSSADHHAVKDQLERKKKRIEIRGLNKNCKNPCEESTGSGSSRRCAISSCFWTNTQNL